MELYFRRIRSVESEVDSDVSRSGVVSGEMLARGCKSAVM